MCFKVRFLILQLLIIIIQINKVTIYVLRVSLKCIVCVCGPLELT